MAAETTETVPTANSKPSAHVQDTNEVQKVFERFDSNGDGKISSEELAGVLKALGSDTSDEEVSRMMHEMDTDNDGFINLQEFASFCKGDSLCGRGDDGEAGAKELHDAFELYDQDHDGFISATELHQILTRLGERRSAKDCAYMIKCVDADGDGRVSFEEFKKMMTNSYKAEA